MTYARNGPLYWYDPSYDSYWIWAGRHFSVGMTDRFFGVILADYDLRPELSEIEAPIFLALGRHDYAVPYETWEDSRESAPNLTLHLFDRSGHFPMLEERGLFDGRLIAWLEEQ